MLAEQTQHEDVLNGSIEDIGEVDVQVHEEEAKVDQPQVKIEYVYEQLPEDPPLITISTCNPPILQGDISDKQVIVRITKLMHMVFNFSNPSLCLARLST